MDFKALARNLLAIADTVIPLVGGPAGAAALAAAKAVAKAFDDVKDALASDDQVALQSKREELEAAVFAHANRTIDSLD